MRLLSFSLSVFSNSIKKFTNINRIRNLARALSQEHLSVSNQETLTGRILLYLNKDSGNGTNETESTAESLKQIRQNVKQLHKLTSNEIMDFSKFSTHENLTRNELLSILKKFDTACYSKLPELSPSNILKLLNVYINIVPGHITEFRFYQHAIKLLYKSLPTLNKKDLLQFIFYVGLKKKNTVSQNMLRQCMRQMDDNFINKLTSEELCIICNSTFKTSTKVINKTLLEKVQKYVNDNLWVLNDSAFFVTLLKTLRHNRCQDDDLLNTISCSIFFNKTFASYSFPMICHILALYADYFYYDEPMFKVFIQQCLKELNESTFKSKKIYLNKQLRGKDIKRFLWVLSMFSEMKLLYESDIKNVIIPKLIERIDSGEFERDIDSLIDMNLYLWMINFRSKELMPYIFTPRNLKCQTLGPKSNLRLNLLLQAVQLEDPDYSKQLPIKPAHIPSNVCSKYQLHKRPLIQRLLNKLNGMSKKMNINYFEFSQEIPHLNIIGITGYRNKDQKVVYIEVLDDYTRIRNIEDDVPVGLMALKLRLLDSLEEGVLVISQKECEEMTDEELNEFLLDEMKLIC